MSMFAWLLVFIPIVNVQSAERDLTNEPGHLQRFGAGRPSHIVDEINGFPDPKQFFFGYAAKSKPLKMNGAAKHSRAFDLWSDQYLLISPSVEENEHVTIESNKKENRTQTPTFMTLQEFVQIYNHTAQYMVSRIPKYLMKDVIVPCPLQCKTVLKDQLLEAMMWFSSGGTKSVVHTDSVDNINCLFRGDKELVMVDPSKYAHKVDIDHPEGSYSGMDVDAVDYVKYPELADVEFYHVNLTAGDCLYIPYLWIHQVRSHGSNLAVNVWWDHHNFIEIDPSFCSTECNTTHLTLEEVELRGLNAVLGTAGAIRDHLKQIIGIRYELSLEQVVAKILGPNVPGKPEMVSVYKNMLGQVVKYLDLNRDGNLTRQELDTADQLVWDIVVDRVTRLMALASRQSKGKKGNYDIPSDNHVIKDEF